MKEWKYQPARDTSLTPRQRLSSARREQGLISAATCLLGHCLARLSLKVYHRLRISGREYLPPDGSFIIVANHASHLDAFALAAALPIRRVVQAFPIAAGDTFFKTPALSAFAALTLNALPLWRRNVGPHALEDLHTRLTQDQCIFILFPEGTRSRTGEIAQFKPGIGRLVAGSSVPVIPCRIRGSFEAWKPGRRWPRPGSVSVTLGPRLTFENMAGDPQGWRQVAQRLQDAVEAL